MPKPHILIANRGEIAIRVARAAVDLGMQTLAVHSTDDAGALHVSAADEAAALPGSGPAAYLDAEGLVALAVERGCAMVHPGYGFLSENAGFARLCAEAGVAFIGPSPDVLDLFGDKPRGLALAREQGVPVIAGTALGDEKALAGFFASLPEGAAMVIKAAAGGGGRGMRVVRRADEIADAAAQCRAEAERAFGSAAIYAEEYLERARHIEVQVIGDGQSVAHLWERECTLQRRHQKLVEIAPSPFISAETREALIEAALRMAASVNYRALGTFEFLVTGSGPEARFAFIEANPRLQVEHTVTEEVTGIDLVASQVRIAQGATLSELGLADGPPPPRGHAIQSRVNTETLGEDGSLRAEAGTVSTFETPSGPGVRIDAAITGGSRVSPAFDPMVAKLVVHSAAADFPAAARKASRALGEFRIGGVRANIGLLRAIVDHPDFVSGQVHTGWIEEHARELVAAAGRFVDWQSPVRASMESTPGTAVPEGCEGIAAPMAGVVHALLVKEGDTILPGQPVAMLEAMKMQHEVRASAGGTVAALLASAGDVAAEGQPIVAFLAGEVEGSYAADEARPDPDHVRADLAEVEARRRIMTDAGRPEAVAKRHALGMRTARENIADLLDDESFVEYGAFTLSNQRQRRSHEELLRLSPGDGVVTGLGSINGDLFGEEQSRAAVLSYDWTVFAGTQGFKGHQKSDRLLHVVREMRLPLVCFSEGGGGRPGDEWGAAHLNGVTFLNLAQLSGLVPLVGINNRYCFAGNAVLLGLCDVIIATRSSSIGMGGPAMIEGGGLGKVEASDVGPVDVQFANGVIDVLVEDEAEAVAVAKTYLAYFQGPLPEWRAADQRLLRHVVPESRVRAYDVREIINLLADTDSVLELRAGFGAGCITALGRIEGRPVGLIANNPAHLGGAIDADAADKSARFMQLCDAFDLPIVMLCDTPGFMVGPEVEKQAQVRHTARLYSVAANVQVPILSVVLRKGYGLGAQGATGGSFHAPMMIVSWPTGEFGGMGLEGAVQLAYAKELAAETDPEAREALYQKHLAELYQLGKALTVAEYFEIDDVIDPADTRRWLMRGLKSVPPKPPRMAKRRPNIDPW